MIKKKIRQGSAILLAAVLGLSAFAITETYAALGVDINAKCSLQIDVPDTGFSELTELDIPVNLYKVADIAVTGKYTVTEAFAEDVVLNVSSETKADEWKTYAAAAKKVVDDSAKAGTPVAKAAAATINNGTVTIGATEEEKLPVGLYLVDAQETLSATYRYSFQPYLISLPNNYYYNTIPGDDTWVYDLTGTKAVSLKPEKADLYGDLVIEKTVDVFNGTYENATFVFQVEAAKADPDAPEGTVSEKVFSDVFAINFTAPGTKSLTVGKIPAGAEVIVTEVYTGASYTVDAATEETVIVADEYLAQDKSNQAKVDFTNTHDGRPNGGNGIVNSFSYDNGAWTNQAYPDSLGAEIVPDAETGKITR